MDVRAVRAFGFWDNAFESVWIERDSCDCFFWVEGWFGHGDILILIVDKYSLEESESSS